MPRPRSLSHKDIATAALAVIDQDGLQALSMRAVAAKLGMGAMSLYRYVSGRKEIERLVTELVFSAVDPHVPQRESWQHQVTELAGRVRTAIGAHPAVIPLVLAHHQTSPSVWRCLEAILGALTGAGCTGTQRVIATRCLTAYVFGQLLNESYMPLTGEGAAALAALSPADYPLAAETAQQAAAVRPDQEFTQGLAIILEGLGARLPSSAD